MTQYTNQPQDDEVISLTEIIRTLLRGKWWIIGCTLLCSLVALTYLLVATPEYSTRALLELKNGVEKDGETQIPLANTAIEVMRSSVVLQPVITREKLDIEARPAYLPLIGEALDRELDNQTITVTQFNVPRHLQNKPFTLTYLGNNAYQLDYQGKTLFNGQVGEIVRAQDNGQTIELLISNLKAPDHSEFVLKKRSMPRATEDLLKQLTMSEQGRNTNIVMLSITGPDTSANEQILTTLIARYREYRSEIARAKLNNEKQQVEAALQTARANLSRAEADLTKIQAANINESTQQEEQQQSITTPTTEIQQTIAAEMHTYNTLLNKRELLKIALKWEAEKEKVQILSYATSSQNPIKPRKPLILALATLLGVMLGIGLVLIREMLTRELTPEELESLTDLKVYTTIPYCKHQNNKTGKRQVQSIKQQDQQTDSRALVTRHPADPTIESLRTLRTNLLYDLTKAHNNRVILTSPLHGAGKTFIAAKLAELLAQAGKKVLLIDTDLRQATDQRESLNHYFAANATTGLTDVFAQPDGNPIVKISERLHLLPSGHPTENPVELLMDNTLTQILERFSTEYDIVLLDTPPLLPYTDSAVIAERCAITLLVVNAQKDDIVSIVNASRRLERVGIPVLGCVINQMTKTGYY